MVLGAAPPRCGAARVLRSTSLAAVLLWTLDLQHGSAQDTQPYLTLIDGYASGHATEAVTALLQWPEGRVRAAVRTLDARVAHDRARTAMMLHRSLRVATGPARRR